MTISQGTTFRRSAARFGDNLAVASAGRTATYRELHQRASRLANVLGDRGLVTGDVVAVLGPNGFEQVEQVVAGAIGGFPRAGLYTYHSAEVNRYLLERIGARALIVEASFHRDLEPLLEDLAGLDVVLVYGKGAPADLDYETALASASAVDPGTETGSDDPHIIRFSSGTTGRPKPIFHTVERWARTTDEWAWITATMTDRTRYVTPIAIAHLGIGLFWNVLRAGGAVIPQPVFDADAALDLIEEHAATHVAAAPVMVRAMLDAHAARARRVDSVECLLYAGSPIAPETMRRATELFGDTSLHQLYAQSEALPATMLFPHQHVLDGDEKQTQRLRSVGRPTPSTEITIRDENGDELPVGEIGEIAIRSPFTMSGIWLDPDATAERLLPDGSVLSRDMGRVDEDGFVYLVDRKDDMIVSGGYNIWPAELEASLIAHDAVAEVTVFGVPDAKWGETPKAAVVLSDGAQVSESDLIEHTREALGGVKKVTSVDFLDALPRTTTGKIERGRLKAPYWAGHDSGIAGS